MGSSPIISTITLNEVQNNHMDVLQIVETILNIAFISLGLIILIYVLIVIFKNDDTDRYCDDDCEHCSFPLCDKSICKQHKQEENDDIHNR